MIYKARIKFADKEWLVVDNIEYDGIKYYYIVEDISEELEELDKLGKLEEYSGKMTLEFIYKLDNGKYKNVTDEELLEKLHDEVAIKAINSNNE